MTGVKREEMKDTGCGENLLDFEGNSQAAERMVANHQGPGRFVETEFFGSLELNFKRDRISRDDRIR